MTEPLSDEELATIEATSREPCSARDDVARLVAEVRRLRARLQLQIDATVTACEDASALRAEVERLRADLASALDGWDSGHEEVTGYAPRVDPQSAAIRERHGL